MGVDADELIIRPFKEVVERGHEAATNSGEAGHDHDGSYEATADSVGSRLAKAGHALVKEGERALKRLQPIWDSQVEKYGDAFKDAMLQQDEIEKKRLQLEDLLYDFEDYIEPETFDSDKFAALQAATRSLALDVINHAKRLKLESPRRDSSASQLAAAAAATIASTRGKTFPPLPPLPPVPPMPPTPRDERRSATSSSFSSLTKTTHPRAASSIPPIPSSPLTGLAIAMGDEDTIPDYDAPHVNYSGPGRPPSSNANRLSNLQDLRRGNTRSSTTTSSSRGLDIDRGIPLDRLERFGEGAEDDAASIVPSIYSSNDAVRIAPGKPTIVDVTSHPSSPQLPLSPSAAIPRTSAWVRNHQVATSARTRSGVRGKTSRDTMATDYSYSNSDSPSTLSRFNSLNVSGTASVALSTAASVFDSSPGSPGAMTDSRTSYMSSAANSYSSGSPVVASPDCMPALPPATDPRDPRFAAPHMTPVTLPPPFVSPSLAPIPSLPSSASVRSAMSSPASPALSRSPHSAFNAGGAARTVSPVGPPAPLSEQVLPSANVLPSPALSPLMHSQSIQDFIQFDPSPPMPLTSLPLSPKLAPQQERPDEDDRTTQHQHPHRMPGHMSSSPEMSAPAIFSLPPAVLPSDPSDTQYDNGLMLAEEATSDSRLHEGSEAGTGTSVDMPVTRRFMREPDCSIGPKSSFTKMGGFCKGAESFRLGGHWQGIKQQNGYVANKQTTIGRCVGCGYGHNYEEVRLDMEKKSEATFTKAGGVRFRLRLLFKSHISNFIVSQRQAESNYACVFCVQAGATVREGDATVFTTPDHLLLHLARHPQPLPAVPGISVIYGEISDLNSELANDFDLHLMRSPLPTPVPQTVGQAAVATAVCDHIQRYGSKKLARPPGYDGDMLQFLAGARIVGLMFPEAWQGKWCMGWHDGFAGAFAAKAVQIEPPRKSEIPMESSSGMKVTARWKWKPKVEPSGRRDGIGGRSGKSGKSGKNGGSSHDNADEKNDDDDDNNDEHGDVDSRTTSETHDDQVSVWLDFDKGETISNVKCLYADHWCWAGTNSKGRYGVFPQSHILTKTLQQDTLVPLRPRTGWSVKGKGLFSKGGSGANARRPPSSSAASSLSSSTGHTRRS